MARKVWDVVSAVQRPWQVFLLDLKYICYLASAGMLGFVHYDVAPALLRGAWDELVPGAFLELCGLVAFFMARVIELRLRSSVAKLIVSLGAAGLLGIATAALVLAFTEVVLPPPQRWDLVFQSIGFATAGLVLVVAAYDIERTHPLARHYTSS